MSSAFSQKDKGFLTPAAQISPPPITPWPRAAVIFTLSVIAQTDHPASSIAHPDTVILSEAKNLPSNRQSSIVNQPSPPLGETSP